MTKICSKCHSTMPYDPYFKSYVCRQCGNSISCSEATDEQNRRDSIVRKNCNQNKKVASISFR